MKRSVKLATAVAGAVVIGGTLAAGPVIAAANDGPGASGGTTSQSAQPGPQQRGGPQQGGPGMGRGHGMGQGMENGQGQGMGTRDGSCLATGSVTAEQGTLTEAQKKTLAWAAEEEKLAHDLYTAFGDKYDIRVFDRIAQSETNHLEAVRTLLDRYDVADPTTGKAAGEFTDKTVQATYDRLLAQGEKNDDGALKAGVTVETEDIEALTKAIAAIDDAPDAKQVYENLLAGSERHLAAFNRWLG
ncbi:ferritin-like domain-containing protein [Streptomyces xinghaiensis]|uniref:ferritin-like domain-containing protein n=1 Tax=Streptomyces xinghaiensis TaxID=1038928 RepID=UPI0003036319|nr:DUF2202 domain-containing protein [Streptomyces xinghaiensis]MZE76279.1 DUF2202 domain-containing protein [Streptomyces sp. SID5475]